MKRLIATACPFRPWPDQGRGVMCFRTLAGPFVAVASLLFVACGGDSTSLTDLEGDGDIGLAVRIVNTGSGELGIQTWTGTTVNFCYEDLGCTNISGGGWHQLGEGGQTLLRTSQPDTVAVGVRVGFFVTEGEGRAEVLRGEPYLSGGGGWLDFNEGPVVFTSPPFAEGDTVRFVYGIVD
jgi:hypothetical protein